MRKYEAACWPTDKTAFLEKLAIATNTSHKRIKAQVDQCGVFGHTGSGDVVVAVGLTFDEETTDLLRNERLAAADLIKADSSYEVRKRYPHLTLGRLTVSENMRKPLKNEINHLAQSLGAITLLSVHTSYTY